MDFIKHILSDSMKLSHYDSINIKLSLIILSKIDSMNDLIILSKIDSMNDLINLSVIDSMNDCINLSVIDSMNDCINLSVIDSINLSVTNSINDCINLNVIDCIDLRLKIKHSLNIKQGLKDSIKHSLNDIKDNNHKNICDINPQSTRAITLNSMNACKMDNNKGSI